MAEVDNNSRKEDEDIANDMLHDELNTREESEEKEEGSLAEESLLDDGIFKEEQAQGKQGMEKESQLEQVENDTKKSEESEKPKETEAHKAEVHEGTDTDTNVPDTFLNQLIEDSNSMLNEQTEVSNDEEKVSDTTEKYSASGKILTDSTEVLDENQMDTIFEDEPNVKEDKELLAEVNFDLLEMGRWLLKVIGGPNTGAEFAMQASSSYLIGTDPKTCDIVFHDTSVSRQHARIVISDEDTLILEDLKSRNGIMIDGQRIENRVPLEPNVVVTLGTTSFIVFDREGEMQTIISPMLPSIVKALQKDEEKHEEVKTDTGTPITPTPPEVAAALEPPARKSSVLGAFALIAAVTGLLVIVGMGTLALFRSEPVVIQEPINVNSVIGEAIAPFPDIKFSFNQPTGRLLLVGHVLTSSEKNQLLNNLQGFQFIKNIDAKDVIIDDIITREINPILNRNKAWRGVTILTPRAGQFVLSGYLQTRDQAERLTEYISSNFPYLDKLDKRIIVEEEITNSIGNMLQKEGIRNVQVTMSSNTVVLTGGIPAGKENELNHIIEEIKAIPGVQRVQSNITQLAPEATMVNISDKYRVSGAANQGGVNLSVVINGRILNRGDILDGMTITSIKPNVIFLEKDGIKYRIDY